MNALRAVRIVLDRIERKAKAEGVEMDDVRAVTAPRRAVERLRAVPFPACPGDGARLSFPRLVPGWHCDVTPDDSDG